MSYYFRKNRSSASKKSTDTVQKSTPSQFHYRHSRRREDAGVDDWLMTYADMITLILCFFAILLSISVPKREEFSDMQSQLHEEFSAHNQADKPSIYVTPLDTHTENIPPTGVTTLAEKTEEKKPAIKQGDRLSIIDMNSASFFTAGSATLSDEGRNVLDKVLETIQSDKFKDYKITVEGHTDDLPISTLQFPSNWELSTARAAAVARYFLKHGVAPQRIRASGYADTFPKVPNRDTQGKAIPENQAQNRRVVIKLEKVEKDE